MKLSERNPARKSDYVTTTERYTYWTPSDGKRYVVGQNQNEVIIGCMFVPQGVNSRALLGKNGKVEILETGGPERSTMREFPYRMYDEYTCDWEVIDDREEATHQILVIEIIVKCTEK